MIDKTAQCGKRRGKKFDDKCAVTLYRIIIALLRRLLDIGFAKWNEDENIFAAEL